MTKTQKVELCDECRFDGGQHYDVDLDGKTTVTKPHHDQAALLGQARAIVEAAHEQQVTDARRIVAAFAETHFEFSANDCAEAMNDAGIDGPVVGAAFAWAQEQGVIVATGRRVKHRDAHVRHRINLWRSVQRARALGESA
jgi:hypothetical protein